MPRAMVDRTAPERRDSLMAKRAKRGTYSHATQALAGARVPKQEFGQFHPDGTLKIDLKKLEALKKKLGKTTWRKVRFVALNAPFKRRSPISPA